MSDSQAALREVQKLLGGFKALMPILENAASIETQVKAGEARLVALKMETSEVQDRLEKVNESFKCNDEALRTFIKEKNDEGQRIRKMAEDYAAQKAGEANAEAQRVLTEAKSKVEAALASATKLKGEIAELRQEVGTLTDTRDKLRREINRIKETLGA